MVPTRCGMWATTVSTTGKQNGERGYNTGFIPIQHETLKEHYGSRSKSSILFKLSVACVTTKNILYLEKYHESSDRSFDTLCMYCCYQFIPAADYAVVCFLDDS